MIKSITFIVLTQFFHFNELFKAARLLYFFKLNQQYFISAIGMFLKELQPEDCN